MSVDAIILPVTACILHPVRGMTTDQLINLEDGIPNEVMIEDEPLTQQLKLINQLDDDDRNVIFKMIDTMLTKKKFQDFFQKNLPATH